jgi:hypothetical protein
MAENGPASAGEARRHPDTAGIQLWTADGVDATMDGEQPTSGESVLDRLVADPESEQRAMGDRSVPTLDQRPDLATRCVRACGAHRHLKGSRAAGSPPGHRFRARA